MKVKQEPWQIAAARFCVEQKDKDFTVRQIKEFLLKAGYEVYNGHVDSFFYDEVKHPAGIQFDRTPRTDETGVQSWTAPLQLVSTIIDYDELKLARQNARSAWKMALIAIIISAVAAIFQALQYFTSTS